MNGTGRIALVTGAGTGIGKRTAVLLDVLADSINADDEQTFASYKCCWQGCWIGKISASHHDPLSSRSVSCSVLRVVTII